MNANVINSLNEILADSIVLYQKLHHFHWRVKGRGFFQLHAKFEEMYNHFAGVSDEVAERILMIGGEPLASLKQALEISSVKESHAVPAAGDMVIELRGELDRFRGKIRSAVDQAEEAGDRGSVGLLDPIADALDKEIWMLDAFLAE
jgi:starvation-inducible DNA-binding protein